MLTQAALAAVPPAVALILLLARVRPTFAATAALLSAIVVAGFAFPTPINVVLQSLGGIAATCVEIALILLGGVLLNELINAGGGQQQIAEWLTRTCREPARAVVLIVLGVTPFAESVTGFGVGAVVAVPLLCRIGVPATRAAITGLIGLVTVPWGALGPGTLVAAAFTGVDFQRLGVLTAVLSVPVFCIAGVFGLVVAVGYQRALRAVPELITGIISLSVGVYAVNATLGVPLAGALGSVFSVVMLLGIISLRERHPLHMSPAVRRSLLPYGLLMVGLLSGNLIAAVATPDDSTVGFLIASPATWLLFTCALTPALLRIPPALTLPTARTGIRRWFPVAATTVAFLLVGTVLTATGMSTALAKAAAALGNPTYLFFAGFIGALGGFLTGSNTGSNAMFATSQFSAAQALGVNASHIVATQNVAASLATTASAPRVVLAVTLAGNYVTRDNTPTTRHDESSGQPAGPSSPPEIEQKVDERSVLRTVLLYNVTALVTIGTIVVLFVR